MVPLAQSTKSFELQAGHRKDAVAGGIGTNLSGFAMLHDPEQLPATFKATSTGILFL
jgi:hypothetical protein